MGKKDTAGEINPTRNLAVQLVYEVTENKAFANLALNKALRRSGLSAADRSLLTELVNGTVRMLKHLDWVLNLFLRQELARQNPWLRTILRVSAYQILFMNRIPHFALVNDAVEITRKRCNDGLARVANAVLRNLIRQRNGIKYPPADSREYLAVYYSHPQEMVSYLLEHFTREETVRILSYNNRPARLDLRVNRLKTERDLLLKELEKEGLAGRASPNLPRSIRVDSVERPLEELPAYKEGCFYVQNEAAMLAAIILNPQPDETVLDLCCGVGGKTTHLGELMGNSGSIRAYDSYARKINILKENCARLGIDIVEAQAQDIMAIDSGIKGQKILLDAPCSGTGVLNRRSDARWNKDRSQMEMLNRIQYALLTRAAALLNPGGHLLYSTCSIRREENERLIEAFLEQADDFALEGFNQQLSFFPLDESDKEKAARGMLTLIPGKYDVDGMFYALLRRK
ncbi:16S rRNA (cytosine(967)-C(5))-methyltransferase RsmB [Syntrophomonas curvata]